MSKVNKGALHLSGGRTSIKGQRWTFSWLVWRTARRPCWLEPDDDSNKRSDQKSNKGSVTAVSHSHAEVVTLSRQEALQSCEQMSRQSDLKFGLQWPLCNKVKRVQNINIWRNRLFNDKWGKWLGLLVIKTLRNYRILKYFGDFV